MWHLIKYAVKQKYNSLSKAKSALLYRQFHLPVSCDLRCYSRIRGILIREIQRNQRFRTRGCFPLRHRCLSPKFVTEYLRYKHIGERKREIGICRLIFHQSLYFQGIFAVKCQILMFCPCFYPYQPKQGQILYCPTTISSSFADFFFASLVAWAYTFIVVLTSECPRSSCTSFGCAPFSNRFVV